MKDCAFQYATNDGLVLENTGLITLTEAEILWDKYIPTFKEHLESDRLPEMCIWVEMVNDTNYHKTSKHIKAEDAVLRDGRLFELVAV